MAAMARARTLVAAVMAVVAIGLPPPAGSSDATASPFVAATDIAASAIIPGSAGRSSLDLDATYRATLRLGWTTRAIWVDSTATILNTSDGPIDRIELNTIAARLGGIRLRPVTVDGVPVPATISDQTILVPLGGILPAGAVTRIRVRFGGRLRSGLAGSDWLFTRANGIADLYRWLPWVSRRIAFDRPNHGDPFETPISPSVRVTIVTDRRLVLATTGDRVSASAGGLSQIFEARAVRDFTVTAAADFRTISRLVGSTTVRAWFRPGRMGRPSSMPRPTRSARFRPGSGRTGTTPSTWSSRPAASGWSHRG